jgi:hypothetical protein
MPPALATALARLAGQAPAIGACNIGTGRPNLWQNLWQNRSARARAPNLGELTAGGASADVAIVTLVVI